MTSSACLVMSGLNNISHFKAHLRSPLNKFADSVKSHTVENDELPSTNNIAEDSKFSERSLIYIKKSSGLNTDPWGTPVRGLFKH